MVTASCPEWLHQTGSVFISLVVLASRLKSQTERPRPVLGLEGSGLGQELRLEDIGLGLRFGLGFDCYWIRC